MTFADFFEKYYLPHQQTEIVLLLSDLCIYSEIETSLNDFYETTNSKHKNEIVSQFVLTIRDFTTTINKRLHDIEQSEHKNKIEQKIVELSIYLIRDTYYLSGLEQAEYFDLLKQTIKKTYAKHSWDFTALETLLNLDNINTFATTENKKRRNTIKLSKPIQLDWKSSQPLDFFVDDIIKTFKGIKTKTQLYSLFNLIETDFKVELPSKHLLPFLTLFYELHECEAIKVIGNRGLFVYLKQHLQPPTKDKYPRREFRKLRHEAEVDEKTKNEISRMIKHLLDKYCMDGQ
ncbi:MAG: hypothetical protein JNL57_01250 [Bacteroidetes bacterium]|nr:hypothetical protein [Bacteroidota bacterium]